MKRQFTTVKDIPGRYTRSLGLFDQVPDLLIIDLEPTGSCFLWRVMLEGAWTGDTWHKSIEAALEQASHEFPQEALGEWIEIPESVPNDAKDIIVYVRNFVIEHRLLQGNE